MDQAQYNRDVQETPLFMTNETGEATIIEDYKALTRSDDDKLLGVVGKSYKPMPNTIFADLVNELAMLMNIRESLQTNKCIIPYSNTFELFDIFVDKYDI